MTGQVHTQELKLRPSPVAKGTLPSKRGTSQRGELGFGCHDWPFPAARSITLVWMSVGMIAVRSCNGIRLKMHGDCHGVHQGEVSKRLTLPPPNTTKSTTMASFNRMGVSKTSCSHYFSVLLQGRDAHALLKRLAVPVRQVTQFHWDHHRNSDLSGAPWRSRDRSQSEVQHFSFPSHEPKACNSASLAR